MVNCFAEIEILQLSEGLERGHGDNVDAEDLREARVVHEERVLRCEESALVGVKGACIFDHVDVLWWPASRDVGDHDLLEQRPVPTEPNVEARLFWHVR